MVQYSLKKIKELFIKIFSLKVTLKIPLLQHCYNVHAVIFDHQKPCVAWQFSRYFKATSPYFMTAIMLPNSDSKQYYGQVTLMRVKMSSR
jgi:hypothetical protein